MQDLLPSDCCGSSEEDEDSKEDTGEDTYVDEFSPDDDDDSDAKGDIEKWETASIRIFFCSR